jgi:hypothetical protein
MGPLLVTGKLVLCILSISESNINIDPSNSMVRDLQNERY